MMILSNDDVNVGKVRGWVTEELPEAEAPSTWAVLSVSVHPLWLQMTSRGKMAALESAAAPLQRREEARTITAFFICLFKKNNNNPFHLQTTSDTRTQLNK